jgi:hypothetical protein
MYYDFNRHANDAILVTIEAIVWREYSLNIGAERNRSKLKLFPSNNTKINIKQTAYGMCEFYIADLL